MYGWRGGLQNFSVTKFLQPTPHTHTRSSVLSVTKLMDSPKDFFFIFKTIAFNNKNVHVLYRFLMSATFSSSEITVEVLLIKLIMMIRYGDDPLLQKNVTEEEIQQWRSHAESQWQGISYIPIG